MLKPEDIEKMSFEELGEKERELLTTIDTLRSKGITDERNPWFAEVYNDYILVSDKLDEINEDSFTKYDWDTIKAYEKLLDDRLLNGKLHKEKKFGFRVVK